MGQSSGLKFDSKTNPPAPCCTHARDCGREATVDIEAEHMKDVFDAHHRLCIPALESRGGGGHVGDGFMARVPLASDALDPGDLAQMKPSDAWQTAQHHSFTMPFGRSPDPTVTGKLHETKQVECLVDAQKGFIGRLKLGHDDRRQTGIKSGLRPPLDAAEGPEAARPLGIDGPPLVTEFTSQNAWDAQGQCAGQDGPFGP